MVPVRRLAEREREESRGRKTTAPGMEPEREFRAKERKVRRVKEAAEGMRPVRTLAWRAM